MKTNSLIILSIIILTISFNAFAQEVAPDCYVGMYLLKEDTGDYRFITLTSDGLAFSENSTQVQNSFSDPMGTWTATGENQAKVFLLDLGYDEEGLFYQFGHVIMMMNFSENCNIVDGSYDLRLIPEGIDPLSPKALEFEVKPYKFTARKVVVE